LLTKKINPKPVKIITDGVISNIEWADGRPIPAIMVDASNRPDISEYIVAHTNQPPGDITSQWGRKRFSKKIIGLILKSARPVLTEFVIEFNSLKHNTIIEGILISKGLYLQTGKQGDKVSNNLQKPSILIEIPETGFAPTWEKILEKTITRKFKKQGLGRKNAKNASKEYIKSMREFWAWRRL
jgi:hypothetical protein